MIGQVFYKVSGTLAAPLWTSSGLALLPLHFLDSPCGTIAAAASFGDHLYFTRR
jgi:hypothetical protein